MVCKCDSSSDSAVDHYVEKCVSNTVEPSDPITVVP